MWTCGSQSGLNIVDLVNCHLATGLGIMVKCLAFASSLLPAAVTSSGCSSALVAGVESNVCMIVHYCMLLLYVFGRECFELLRPSRLFEKAELGKKSRLKKKKADLRKKS